MWRAYLLKFVLNIRYNNQLLERLRGSRKLREVCGFGDAVPSESALSRFVHRLADHQDLVEQCLNALTGEVRELAPPVKPGKKGKPDQPLPPLGEVLAIDSTLFLTYSNPNRRVLSDSDVRWGVKHSAKAKEGGTEWGFGYKKHLIFDATHGIPLAFIITPANVGDSTQLPVVVQKALDTHPWLRPKYLLAAGRGQGLKLRQNPGKIHYITHRTGEYAFSGQPLAGLSNHRRYAYVVVGTSLPAYVCGGV